MSFQDLDFKSDGASVARSVNQPAARSGLPLNLLFKLLMVMAVITLLGFSASNWPRTAEAADSTLMSARLHYSLPLPAIDPALEQAIAESVPEPEEIE